jgi:plastocyanin
MKTNLIIIISLVAVLLIVGGIYLFIQKPYTAPPITNPSPGTSNNPYAGTNNTSSNQPNNSVGSGLPAPQVYNVEISNFAFSPSTLTINVGDTVIWTNLDSVSHTITSDIGGELSSSTFGNGQTYSHYFTAAGIYDYHCSIHTSMKGEIVVQ